MTTTYKGNAMLRLMIIIGLSLFLLSEGYAIQDKSVRDSTITSLKFIGLYVVPHNQIFQETTVGGLSGIDYDSKHQLYYLVSDDRSALNPVRYYTARITFSENAVDTVEFSSVHFLLHPNGNPYPSAKQDATQVSDPESIRFNSRTGYVVWTSEGERIVKPDKTVLVNPAINIATPDGKFVGTFTLPENLTMQATENGPRQNSALEGITFTPDFKFLYATIEEPRYEDGPRATLDKTNSWVRLYKFDVQKKKRVAEYAYPLEPIAYPTMPPGAFMVNGVSEILFFDKDRLITVERSFSTGRLACSIRVFLTDLRKADRVENIISLQTSSSVRLPSKRLLLNMDSLGMYIDNVEGVTFGPDLPNGHRTLVFVADNNFVALERTQILVFEVIP